MIAKSRNKNFPKINKLLLKEGFFCMLFSFIVLGLVNLVGVNLSFFAPFNNAFKDFSYLDLYYAEKMDENIGYVNKDIILVNINRLDRKEIAYLLDRVEREKPSVIGLDVIFKEEKTPSGDRALAQSHGIKNLVTTYALSNSGIVKSSNRITRPQQITAYSNFSFNTESSVVRNFQGFKKDKDSIQVSFGTAIAKKFLKSYWPKNLEKYLQKERPINYKGNHENFMILENEDIIGQDTLAILKDKIVLLGYLGNTQNHEFDIEDKHFTPMNKKFVGKSPPDMFGIVVHANIINMIITDDFISVVPTWLLVVFTIVLTYLALLYFIWLAKRQPASYILKLNIMRLVLIVIFVWITLSSFRIGILFKTAGIIAVVAFSLGLIVYYKKLVNSLHKKFKWNGYFYQN